MKERGQLVPFLVQIRHLAEQGLTCPEIQERLRLPVEPEQVRRFCHRHGFPVQNRGAQPGAKHRDWKGGRTIDKDGYVLVQCPQHPHANAAGYVREHRLVMEAAIGRFLEPTEVVHHVDDDHQHNAIENLRLYSGNSQHLAETLKGKCPEWTPEGRRRTLEGVRRGHRNGSYRQHLTNLSRSKTGGRQ